MRYIIISLLFCGLLLGGSVTGNAFNIYINESIGQGIETHTFIGIDTGEPIKFASVDKTVPKIEVEEIYTSLQHQIKIEEIIIKIKQLHPEWFKGDG